MSFDMNSADEDPHGECRHEIHSLQQRLAEAERERERLRQFSSRQTEEIEALHDMADAVERLREIGRATGCDHVDSSDGRAQLVNCVEQVIAQAEIHRDEARQKNEDLMDLIRRSLMKHGDCKSGERYGGLPKACTACMAQLELKELSKAWKGRTVRLA